MKPTSAAPFTQSEQSRPDNYQFIADLQLFDII